VPHRLVVPLRAVTVALVVQAEPETTAQRRTRARLERVLAQTQRFGTNTCKPSLSGSRASSTVALVVAAEVQAAAMVPLVVVVVVVDRAAALFRCLPRRSTAADRRRRDVSTRPAVLAATAEPQRPAVKVAVAVVAAAAVDGFTLSATN
jgi:hypothetical protein